MCEKHEGRRKEDTGFTDGSFALHLCELQSTDVHTSHTLHDLPDWLHTTHAK